MKEEASAELEKKNAGFKLLTPEKAAQIIIRGMEGDKRKVLPGTDSTLMDFLYRVAPFKAGNMICKVREKNHAGIFNTPSGLRELRWGKAL